MSSHTAAAGHSLPTALVTGASRGIGRALATVLAQHGHDVVLAARDAEQLRELAEELHQRHGVQAWSVPCDLARSESPQRLHDEILERGIRVELLVNNAGFGNWGPFVETPMERELELIQLNITALTQLTKLYLVQMLPANRGWIMNVASTGAFQPGPLMTTYYASKAYVLSFSEALASELATTNVKISCLCPGVTRTNFMERAQTGELNLFRFGMMRAEDVALAGYRGLMAGRRVVVPGVANRLLAVGAKVAPRSMSAAIVHKLMKRK